MAVLLAFRRIVYGSSVLGWTTLILVILIIGGLQMLMLGIIGEYVWRTLAQARGREKYVIDQVYDLSSKVQERLPNS